MRAAVYVRVSTDRQSTEGESLEMQIARAREVCETHGWELAEVYQDVISGRKDKRPALQRFEKALKAGRFDAVICYKVDRLGRTRRKLHELLEWIQQHDVRLVSMTQQIDTATATGRMMLAILVDFAVFEVEQLSERISDTMLHMAKQGHPVSGMAPFGYRHVSKRAEVGEDGREVTAHARLEVIEAEAEVVREMVARYLAGESLAGLAKHLNASGSRTREGNPWQVTSVKFVLLNPLYAGLRVLRRWSGPGGRKFTTAQMLDRMDDWQVVDGGHAPIVTPEQLAQVRARYLSERRIPARARSAKNPWSGLLVCGECGSRLVTYQPASSRGSSLAFRCRQRMMRACGATSFAVTWLEVEVVKAVSEALSRAGAVEAAAEVGKGRPVRIAPKMASTERLVAAKRRELSRLEFKFDHEVIDGATFLAERKRLLAEIEALQATQEAPKPVRRLVLPRPFAETYRALEVSSDRIEDRRKLLRLIVDRIVVGPESAIVTLHTIEGLDLPRAIEVARWAPGLKRKVVKPWSRTQAACSNCGSSERPHLAKGMCGPCYKRRQRGIVPPEGG